MTDLFPNIETVKPNPQLPMERTGRLPLANSEFEGVSNVEPKTRKAHTFNLNSKVVRFLEADIDRIAFFTSKDGMWCLLARANVPQARQLSRKTSNSGALTGASFSVGADDYLKDYGFEDRDSFRLIHRQTTGDGHWFKMERNMPGLGGADPILTISAPTLSGRADELATKRLQRASEQEPFEAYRAVVDSHTGLICKTQKSRIQNSSDLGRKGYHVDHIFSVRDGFDNQIPPEVIGHWSNLRVILGSENMSKGTRSDKTEEALLFGFATEAGFIKTMKLVESYRNKE